MRGEVVRKRRYLLQLMGWDVNSSLKLDFCGILLCAYFKNRILEIATLRNVEMLKFLFFEEAIFLFNISSNLGTLIQ